MFKKTKGLFVFVVVIVCLWAVRTGFNEDKNTENIDSGNEESDILSLRKTSPFKGSIVEAHSFEIKQVRPTNINFIYGKMR